MTLENIKSLLNNNNFDFHYIDEVDSTMLKIKQINSNRNLLLMANKQTKGMGRRGSTWTSPSGNVYISIKLQNILDTKYHFLNTAYTSNIICEVIEKICNIETKIKWPNDILIEEKKISGVISEIYKSNNNIIISTGLGVNITTSPKVTDYVTTHINEYNKNIDNIKFVYELLNEYLKNLHLLKNYSKSILDKYKLRLKFLSKNIKLKLDNNFVKQGIFYGLNEDGSIILKTNSIYENIYNARIIK